MISKDAIAGLPQCVRQFLVFEQRNLWKAERLRDPMDDDQLDGKYLPEGGCAFRLPCFWIQRRHLYVYGRQEEPGFEMRSGAGNSPHGAFLFPLHPAEVRQYEEFLANSGAEDAASLGLRFWATPTSSTRTLLVWLEGRPESAFFAKLSLHSRFLGDRRLKRKQVALSVGLSRLVKECGCALPSGIGYLAEPFGLVPRVMPDSGALFRSVPVELKDNRVVLAPLFALMGSSEGHPPLLLRLMETCRASAREVLQDILLRGFADIWVDLVFEFGLILEAHGQDLLLALSRELVPLNRLYYRDFEGLTVDWALRRAMCLPEGEAPPHTFEWFSTYETWGYRLYQLVSIKLRTSLFDYVNLVLAELEAALRQWEADGLVRRERFCAEGLTSMFSLCLRRAILEKFGMREQPQEYDIQHNLNRFVKFLMQVRREVMLGVDRSSLTEGGMAT